MKNYEDDLGLSYIKGDWPAIEKIILENVTDWSICIQAGGHFGTYPKNLAKMFGTVYTFEADEENYNILAENCKNQNIIHRHAALTSYPKSMDVFKVINGNSGQRMVYPGTQIPGVTIDSLKLPSCGLIQLDIERHELHALMGAIETIERYHPVVLLEGPETTNNVCNGILEQLGYEFVGRAAVDSMFVYTGRQPPSKEYEDAVKKKILIAIPTARYIEADTFKSIYDLEVPEGYEVTYQHFYGYRVDQVRNLIADWVVRGFDYLFSIDHDITFPPDTLKRLLAHNVDLVSGVYRQRLEPQRIEIYDFAGHRMEYADIYNKPIVEIGGCGFGCVLVRKDVFQVVGYPQFEYHPALNHDNTISEDTDFCRKARENGVALWCDPSIVCGHIGSTTMHVQPPAVDPVQARLRSIHDQRMLPKEHVDYLFKMANSGINPKVIYDIGACVMHWTNEARQVWPNANIVMFDAMNHAEFLYKESGLPYYCDGPLGDTERWVKFYEDAMNPAGSSVFKEDTPFFTEEHAVNKKMRTLDSIIVHYNVPKPDLVKIDVQGAELLILNGAQETLSECKDIIIELQHQEYNLGAPKVAEVTEYLNSLGFVLVDNIIKTDVDGDYHFKRV